MSEDRKNDPGPGDSVLESDSESSYTDHVVPDEISIQNEPAEAEARSADNHNDEYSFNDEDNETRGSDRPIETIQLRMYFDNIPERSNHADLRTPSSDDLPDVILVLTKYEECHPYPSASLSNVTNMSAPAISSGSLTETLKRQNSIRRNKYRPGVAKRPRRQFVCTICQLKFETPDLLDHHVDRVHLEASLSNSDDEGCDNDHGDGESERPSDSDEI